MFDVAITIVLKQYNFSIEEREHICFANNSDSNMNFFDENNQQFPIRILLTVFKIQGYKKKKKKKYKEVMTSVVL